jgi:hypothetical protein
MKKSSKKQQGSPVVENKPEKVVGLDLGDRQDQTAFKNKDVLARLRQVQSQCPAPRSSANHNRVIFAWHIHLQHGIRFTCSKIRIHCRRGP